MPRFTGDFGGDRSCQFHYNPRARAGGIAQREASRAVKNCLIRKFYYGPMFWTTDK